MEDRPVPAAIRTGVHELTDPFVGLLRVTGYAPNAIFPRPRRTAWLLALRRGSVLGLLSLDMRLKKLGSWMDQKSATMERCRVEEAKRREGEAHVHIAREMKQNDDEVQMVGELRAVKIPPL